MISMTEIANKEQKYSFQNIISLGHFCAPAMQLEKYGFRRASYPFDWLIIRDFRLVLYLIQNGYSDTDFLEPSCFAQAKKKKMYYQNVKTKVRFLHDFDAFRSFEQQWDDFSNKYTRRMLRFQRDISTPTLFIRYIGSKEELCFISNNIDSIDLMIKEKCAQNEILYVCDSNLKPEIDIYVTQTEDGKVNFAFMENPDKGLLDWLRMNYTNELSFHKHKKSKISQFISKIKSLVISPYQHEQTYGDLD